MPRVCGDHNVAGLGSPLCRWGRWGVGGSRLFQGSVGITMPRVFGYHHVRDVCRVGDLGMSKRNRIPLLFRINSDSGCGFPDMLIWAMVVYALARFPTTPIL